ncbi:unnamed protein product [Boreogadus saida]
MNMWRKTLAWANKEVALETFLCILGEEEVVYDVYVAAAAIDIRFTIKVLCNSDKLLVNNEEPFSSETALCRWVVFVYLALHLRPPRSHRIVI